MKRLLTVGFASFFLLLSLTALARDNDDYSPRRLGAFSGAMKYCSEKHDEREAGYRRARLKVAREVAEMSRRNKEIATRAGDTAYDTGRFLGKRLGIRECRSLLRESEWHRYR